LSIVRLGISGGNRIWGVSGAGSFGWRIWFSADARLIRQRARLRCAVTKARRPQWQPRRKIFTRWLLEVTPGPVERKQWIGFSMITKAHKRSVCDLDGKFRPKSWGGFVEPRRLPLYLDCCLSAGDEIDKPDLRMDGWAGSKAA